VWKKWQNGGLSLCSASIETRDFSRNVASVGFGQIPLY
jgi:hypothetical protein